MKKKVDPRIRQCLQEGVNNNHRSLIVLVGDKGRDQVVNLHYMLSKMTLQSRPSVLWCYKHELGFSSNKKKRMKIIKKRIKQGLVDPNRDDPFELFISSTSIRFAYYSESHKILGNTYGMCVLQDFEALTPNLLARTLETVQGGGLAVILINNMSSLKKLYSITMDVHARLRTEAHRKVVPRFNERFILSLADCPAAIVADDELNVLPISSHVRAMSGEVTSTANRPTTENEPELKELKESLADTPPIGPLIAKAKTLDQAKALLRFEEAISEKTLRSTVALTASRGRGKSAALGLAVAAAVAHDYANIFVTSPSPENLRTFFAFLFVGFDAMDYQEHTDYEIIQSTDSGLNNAIVRVNVFRSHRQTIQYIDPIDAPRSLSQAELLVIDEAAAIPLPVIESMLGPYLVFMCSTITGYEGTGRSLSLKLMTKLREGSARVPSQYKGVNGNSNRQSDRDAAAVSSRTGSGRVFREVQMEIPIRYGQKDPVEAWLYDLLCLEAGGVRQVLTGGAPHPEECELYYVERDALFSRHSASEAFLHRIMALFVSSHYKNSPNDLQMLSDAPAHGLFVLLAPTRPDTERLPDVLCAIQVCLEGKISSKSSKTQLSRGQRASGDLIPWTISQQFQEPDFATLSGARVVRVATHPDVQKMGYGTRALKLLLEYYKGEHNISLENNAVERLSEQNPPAGQENGYTDSEQGDADQQKKTLLNEIIGPRKNIPPLLRRLHERSAENLDYLGVSYGVTQGLYSFWSRLGFMPLYLRLTPNDLTGEHTCIMATTSVCSSEETKPSDWLSKFNQDFRRRFVHLLGYDFRSLPPGLALAILNTGAEFRESGDAEERSSIDEIKGLFTPYDRRRLESYSRSLIDYHVILDMIPKLAELYGTGSLGLRDGLRLSPAQNAVLMGIGLQRCSVDDLEKRLGIQASQVLALLNKVIRKMSTFLRDMEETDIASRIGQTQGARGMIPGVTIELPNSNKAEFAALSTDDPSDEKGTPGKSLKAEEDGAGATEKGTRMSNFKVGGSKDEWKAALPKNALADGIPSTVSIKSGKKKSKRKTISESKDVGTPRKRKKKQVK
ncbi:unnamed protein product [Chondrus crispus]|uniref:RNA cytidine acetyltransferase n=1 Tax=Chondrus crispus TaxID=2769 RepID=R7QQA6_CHOCR|nr:unnamed protein product [Chondrus crispus]CDF39550.1 unnamed protein product [Chondrus crispus]|eukprot:XP_005709844.1 unnamed protein product [Chondrus crispus]